ncbi:MAG TPA: hypothetical protein PKB07_05605 [Flavilitoribacter sp.]|nr:hypothetical protein [Flavilitoribacter sp.]
MTQKDSIECNDVLITEDEHLRERRKKLFDEAAADKLAENRFGIALSGGGIRSATINLGFLKTLNKFNILEQADYLSTVSGGGYTGCYVHATLKETGSYDELFQEKHIDYMRRRGEYLFPGTGWLRVWNQFILIVGFLISLVMSLISPAIVILLGVGIYMFLADLIFFDQTFVNMHLGQVFLYGGIVLGVVFAIHYMANVTAYFNLDVSARFNRLEALVAGLGLGAIAVVYILGFREMKSPDLSNLLPYMAVGVMLIAMGFFTNPNATSFNRFYRKQLADAFLRFSGKYRNVLLGELFNAKSDKKTDYIGPYPLINTTLNLQASHDPNFMGAKASDYFLLSPLFCGAKLTGYVPTAKTMGYQSLTLPTGVTISAAAVNPGMGAYSSKPLSVATTLLNLRLGYWIWNPLKLKTTYPVVFWPFYFFYELFSRIGTDKKMVNISDGGHIENLGVMELLRRKCRLILAVDAGADPDYVFADLENLTIRARNELGIDIRFRSDQVPEDIIKPRPSYGYSQKRFAIADLYQLWDKVPGYGGGEVIEHYLDKKIGTLVYVKSSVTAPEGRPDISKSDFLKYGTYKYKIYHPTFPHESTADQFFDPVQWESYYQLGQYIGADVLGMDRLDDHEGCSARVIGIDELVDHFDFNKDLFLPLEEEAPETVKARGGLETLGEEEKVVEKVVEYKM